MDELLLTGRHSLGVTRELNWFTRIALCLYFAITIFEPFLNGIIGSVTKYYIFVVMLLLLGSKRKLRFTKLQIVYVVWLLFKIFSLLWSKDYSTFHVHIVSQVGNVVFLFILLGVDIDEKTIIGVKWTYWIASAIMGFLSLFFTTAFKMYEANRQTLTILGVTTDPNDLAAFIIVGICISLDNLFFKKELRLLSFGIFLVNIFACFKTGSRAGLVTIIALALFCIVYAQKEAKPITKLRNIAVFIVGIYAVYFIVVNYLPISITQRLFDFQTYAGGSRRDIIWTNAWNLYTEDLLSVFFGIGWGTVSGVHNTFLAMLCNVGLCITFLFLLPIFKRFILTIKRHEFFPALLLIGEFIPSFFIEAINKRFFWNAIIILFLYSINNYSNSMIIDSKVKDCS